MIRFRSSGMLKMFRKRSSTGSFLSSAACRSDLLAGNPAERVRNYRNSAIQLAVPENLDRAASRSNEPGSVQYHGIDSVAGHASGDVTHIHELE
jgi:hypothetical protein